ncbi:hypothetical protein K504DRAFT_166217 [Pleomassaria siparia CBS 279.74]|uniref:Vacuolar ATPase assembly protein VMA22 n=1 Tax=Pleomassaria siparia CBS 279.74 TaxID=1314801 RepID=A0A6G1JTF8_9PLEO|nr:hypothetical protein K504DRAFT_166217 [Pleomassaria siparia CBS 279.74]
MAEVSTQPGSPGLTSEATDKDALIALLDRLLEQYLHTLDQYQKAQQQLATCLSTGYMSLAQANFNNNSGARYGQDYYDQRMQASRNVTVTVLEANVGFAVSAPDLVVPGPTEAGVEADTRRERSEKVPTAASATLPATDLSQANDASSRPSTTCTTPLRWFGILVPPALKAAQGSFTCAVEGPVPHVASLVKKLRKQEMDIGRLRKQIKKVELKS